MKKFIISLGLGLAMTVSSYAGAWSTTVTPGSFVNLLPGWNNSIQLKQVTIVAGTNGSSSVLLIDTPTNVLTYVNPQYTNVISYATNYVQVWTNFYGTVQSNNYVGGQSLTNFQLIDVPNVVASTTNTYPIRLGLGALAGGSATVSPAATYFNNGIWATNNSSSTATISIVW